MNQTEAEEPDKHTTGHKGLTTKHGNAEMLRVWYKDKNDWNWTMQVFKLKQTYHCAKPEAIHLEVLNK